VQHRHQLQLRSGSDSHHVLNKAFVVLVSDNNEVGGAYVVDTRHWEPLQGQRYDPTASFKAHTHRDCDVCTDASITAVLGCDSVLAFEGEVFGKPTDPSEAIARWQRMAGGWGAQHHHPRAVRAAQRCRD
jgi:hypothetical protein